MKKYTLYIIAALAVGMFVSCDESQKGRIEGTISQAEGKLLVLEHLTEGAPSMIDTVRLDASGKFSFSPEVEKGGPDFFSLRLGNQSIPLVIDTLLSPVHVTAEGDKFANGYSVEDAYNQELREAALCANRLRRSVLNVSREVSNGMMPAESGRDSVAALVDSYKQEVLARFVYANPSSPASYYILCETVNGLLIFDANNQKDGRAFGAVATNWDATYPNSPRLASLKQKTLDGQRYRRAMAERLAARDSILSNTTISESQFPELELRNADDHAVKLSSLVDGKSVVLVDFTLYALNESPAHNLKLGGLYEKYADKGLKIYQVCLDFDENFWKTSADNLPWTTVRDEEVIFDQYGQIQYAPAAVLYNVSSLPTSFLIGKDGEIKVRVESDSKLEAEITKLLK